VAARLLRLWVRIPLGAWIFVSWVLCVVRGLCNELITRQEESYRLWCIVVCDLETLWMRRRWPAVGFLAPPPPQKKKKLCRQNITFNHSFPFSLPLHPVRHLRRLSAFLNESLWHALLRSSEMPLWPAFQNYCFRPSVQDHFSIPLRHYDITWICVSVLSSPYYVGCHLFLLSAFDKSSGPGSMWNYRHLGKIWVISVPYISVFFVIKFAKLLTGVWVGYCGVPRVGPQMN
jgi:hypothetical protein